MNDDAEYYFIQMLFCVNRDLLRAEFRKLYDALFEKYEKIYADGRSKHIDLQDINNKFMGREADNNKAKRRLRA